MNSIKDCSTILDELFKESDWDSNTRTSKKLQTVINSLAKVKMTKQLLQQTGIGKQMKKLSKHSDKIISGYATALISRWKENIGLCIQKDKPRFDMAVANLRQKYHKEKERKGSRNVHVLDKPVLKSKQCKISTSTITTGRNGITSSRNGITTGSRNGSIASNRNGSIASNRNGITSNRNGANTFAANSMGSKGRSSSVPRKMPKDALDAHLRKQAKLRALAGEHGDDGPGKFRRMKSERMKSERMKSSVDQKMLNERYPRIREDGTGKKSSKGMEVVKWLKGLEDDMGEYAKGFIEQGFDSMQTLKMVNSQDIKEIVHKKGHQRMIQLGIDKLQGGGGKKRKGKCRSKSMGAAYEEEYESDDGFIVNTSEDEQYYRKKQIKRNTSYDSSDMEASYEEMQYEEDRSAKIGQREDDIEQERNERMDKKRKRLR